MATVRYQVANLKRWVKAAANPAAFEMALRTNMRKATELNGKIAEKAQRQAIQKGGLKANAPLTVMIKGSSKPLVHKGDLFQSITSQVVDDFTVFTGVLRNTGEYNIAEIVHEGVTIRVTPKMRGMFHYLALVSSGQMHPAQLEGRAAELWAARPGGWKPLMESTTAIVIPGRPWTQIALTTDEFKNKPLYNESGSSIAYTLNIGLRGAFDVGF